MRALPGVVLACLPGRGAVCAAALGLRAQFCEDRAKPHCTAVAPSARDVALRAMWVAPAFCFKSANAAMACASYKMRSTSGLKSLIGLAFDADANRRRADTRRRRQAPLAGSETVETIQPCCTPRQACCNARFRRTWLVPEGRGATRRAVSNAAIAFAKRRAERRRTGHGDVTRRRKAWRAGNDSLLRHERNGASLRDFPNGARSPRSGCDGERYYGCVGRTVQP